MIVLAIDPAQHLPLWKDYLETQFDPAHLLSELGFNVVFDGLFGWLAWGKWIKPYFDRRAAKMHHELDAEHGYTHTQKESND